MRSSIGSLLIRVLGAGLSFSLAVVLARALGPEGYGAYGFVLAILTVLAIPAQAGLPLLVVRETAKADTQQNWPLLRGLWRWSNGFVAAFSLLMLAIGTILLWGDDVWLNDARRGALTIGLALIPLLALGNIRGAALRGLRHVVIGQVPESILRPLLLIGAVLLLATWRPDYGLTPADVVGIHVGAALIALLVASVLLHHLRPCPLRRRPIPMYQGGAWRRAALPLALLAGLYLINEQTDIIMLGIFRSDVEVGQYKAALSLGTLVVFGLQAINQVLQPHFARLYSRGDPQRLQRLVTLSARAILAMALPPVLVLIFFGEWILGTLFGNEYRVAATALAILAFGQVVNAAMGSVGVLLNMTGHERDTVKGVAVAAVCNVLLNAALIPRLGINGAALATAITLVIWNIILRRFVRIRLNIESIAFSNVSTRQS